MRSWFVAVVLGVWMLTGCGRQSVPSIDAGGARALLVAYSRASSDEVALGLTTGKQHEYLKGIIDDRNAGKPSTATAWRAKEDSDVVLLESGKGYAIVQLTYRNSFTSKTEQIKLRLENVNGKWLIANHSDPEGVWWPDYLSH